jgi:hypothetical protein
MFGFDVTFVCEEGPEFDSEGELFTVSDLLPGGVTRSLRLR